MAPQDGSAQSSSVIAVAAMLLGHGLLLAALGFLMIATAPLQLMEGEDPVVVGIVVGLSCTWVLAGGFQILCGVQVARNKWRVPAIVSLIAAAVVTLPMCCGLSIGIAVLGTLLLSSKDAVEHFERAAAAA